MRSPFQTRNRGQRKAKATSQPSAVRAAIGRTGQITIVFDAIGSVFAPRDTLSWSSRATLRTRATDENSFLVFVIAIFVRVFIGVHAPMHVEVVAAEDLVEENAEAMFLGVI